MPILTILSANHLLDALEDYLEKSEASFAMVIDRGGAALSQNGSLPADADTATIAALAAGSFAATKELALRIGETEFSALHQQGEQSQIFMAGIDDDTILVTVFGPQTTLGLVRFYSARTIKRIAAVLMESRTNQRAIPLFSERDVRSTSTIFGH